MRTAAHNEPVWSLFSVREEFASADNEGSIILWSVKDDVKEEGESVLVKRIAVSGIGFVLFMFI